MGDHTETLQIDFDPERITFSDLLDMFWKSHRPSSKSWSRQYMNAVFYHNDEQKQLAMRSKATVEEKTGRVVRTKVLPLESFTRAEDYHQKYILKRRSEFVKDLFRIYPIQKDFVDSTAVARLNGYVGGNGNLQQLQNELEDLGLSPSNKKSLTNLVR